MINDTLRQLEPVLPGVTAAYTGKAWYDFGILDTNMRRRVLVLEGRPVHGHLGIRGRRRRAGSISPGSTRRRTPRDSWKAPC